MVLVVNFSSSPLLIFFIFHFNPLIFLPFLFYLILLFIININGLGRHLTLFPTNYFVFIFQFTHLLIILFIFFYIWLLWININDIGKFLIFLPTTELFFILYFTPLFVILFLLYYILILCIDVNILVSYFLFLSATDFFFILILNISCNFSNIFFYHWHTLPVVLDQHLLFIPTTTLLPLHFRHGLGGLKRKDKFYISYQVYRGNPHSYHLSIHLTPHQYRH